MTQIISNNNWWWGGGWASYTAWTWIEISEQNEISVETDVLNWAAAWATALQSWDNISELNNDANYITSSALSDYQTTANLVTDLTNPDNTHYPSAKAVSDAISWAWAGDMLKSTYDPNNCNSDAFDYCNFYNKPNLCTVATSGKYCDLSWTPTLCTVATSWKYCDLDWQPTIPTVIDSLNSSCTWEALSAKQGCVLNSCVTAINELIPSAATCSNKLTDKNYVDDSINSVTAYYITKNAAGDQFATKAELTAATTFYSGWVVRVPTRNDYTIVLSDEDHDNATTRYIYNSGWEYQYTVNETALTQAQLDALNSWITCAKVSAYDCYATSKQDTLCSQTNYTAKGNCTCVAQITTNCLGQVTCIDEVEIDFPVTSVNGCTWCVCINAVGSSNNTYDNIIHLSQADYNNLGTYDPDTLYSTPEWDMEELVDNTPFWASWDWVTDKAPSMNAVYDVLWDVETLLANI